MRWHPHPWAGPCRGEPGCGAAPNGPRHPALCPSTVLGSPVAVSRAEALSDAAFMLLSPHVVTKSVELTKKLQLPVCELANRSVCPPPGWVWSGLGGVRGARNLRVFPWTPRAAVEDQAPQEKGAAPWGWSCLVPLEEAEPRPAGAWRVSSAAGQLPWGAAVPLMSFAEVQAGPAPDGRTCTSGAGSRLWLVSGTGRGPVSQIGQRQRWAWRVSGDGGDRTLS